MGGVVSHTKVVVGDGSCVKLELTEYLNMLQMVEMDAHIPMGGYTSHVKIGGIDVEVTKTRVKIIHKLSKNITDGEYIWLSTLYF